MKKILIVEDSYIVALHLQATLESEGYIIIGKCTSGEEALEFLKSNSPDLVLMDIMLEGELDGIEAATQIKENYRLPVIYITALSDKDTIARAKITEPYGFLTKPFEDQEIFTVIDMALYKHSVEQKLWLSEEKYFSTLKSISDAVIVTDSNYRITFINPSAQALIQQAVAQAMGKPIFEILKLKDEITGAFPVNPLQCPVGAANQNVLPPHLLLINASGIELPIGETTISLLLDGKERLTGLVLTFRDITEKIEKEKVLKNLEKVKVLSLIEGQEKERGRIAKDLHDGLGQMLNAIKMNAHTIIASNEASDNLFQMIDDSIQECVRISENLLPSKLKDFDLSTCLRSLCQQLNKNSSMEITYNDGDLKLNIDQSKKINLYRIVQEAINNAIKHSHAKHIFIQLAEQAGSIQLSIEDDGIGLPHSGVSEVFHKNGLVNIRDRVEIINGKLTIESDQGRGTLVVVVFSTEPVNSYAKV